MRKLALVPLVVLPLLACSPKNPYTDDPELAKATLLKCHEDLKSAQEAKDAQAIAEMSEKEECNLASQAHGAHIRDGKTTPLNPQNLKKQRPETGPKQAPKNSMPNPIKESEPLRKGSLDPQVYKDMEFEEYYLWSKRCISSIMDRRTKPCEIVRGMMDERYEVEIDKIRQRFKGKPEALEEYSRSKCVGENMVDYLCEFSLRVMNEQKQAAKQ